MTTKTGNGDGSQPIHHHFQFHFCFVWYHGKTSRCITALHYADVRCPAHICPQGDAATHGFGHQNESRPQLVATKPTKNIRWTRRQQGLTALETPKVFYISYDSGTDVSRCFKEKTQMIGRQLLVFPRDGKRKTLASVFWVHSFPKVHVACRMKKRWRN